MADDGSNQLPSNTTRTIVEQEANADAVPAADSSFLFQTSISEKSLNLVCIEGATFGYLVSSPLSRIMNVEDIDDILRSGSELPLSHLADIELGDIQLLVLDEEATLCSQVEGSSCADTEAPN